MSSTLPVSNTKPVSSLINTQTKPGTINNSSKVSKATAVALASIRDALVGHMSLSTSDLSGEPGSKDQVRSLKYGTLTILAPEEPQKTAPVDPKTLPVDPNEMFAWLQNPANLSLTVKVTFVFLKEMGLTEFPDQLPSLFPSLSTFDVSGNGITKLPESGISVTGSLDVSHNQLTTLPTALFARHVNASYNRIASLPEGFGGVMGHTIGTLDLSNNQLDRLPTLVAPLLFLSTLRVKNNRLTTLSNFVGPMTPALVQISAANNCLTKFPTEQLSLLPRYEVRNYSLIDVRNNQITEIPPGFSTLNDGTGMANVTDIDLRGNPVMRVPIEVMDAAQVVTIPEFKPYPPMNVGPSKVTEIAPIRLFIDAASYDAVTKANQS
jgi:Leucine-rich repeat (LRR) protein